MVMRARVTLVIGKVGVWGRHRRRSGERQISRNMKKDEEEKK